MHILILLSLLFSSPILIEIFKIIILSAKIKVSGG